MKKTTALWFFLVASMTSSCNSGMGSPWDGGADSGGVVDLCSSTTDLIFGCRSRTNCLIVGQQESGCLDDLKCIDRIGKDCSLSVTTCSGEQLLRDLNSCVTRVCGFVLADMRSDTGIYYPLESSASNKLVRACVDEAIQVGGYCRVEWELCYEDY